MILITEIIMARHNDYFFLLWAVHACLSMHIEWIGKNKSDVNNGLQILETVLVKAVKKESYSKSLLKRDPINLQCHILRSNCILVSLWQSTEISSWCTIGQPESATQLSCTVPCSAEIELYSFTVPHFLLLF